MKYIKEYNEFNKLVELSEYLQEIFDEFNIPYNENITENIGWFIFSNTICINMGNQDRIGLATKYYDIKNRLEERREYLEGRLGGGILIEYWEDEIEISID